MALLTIKRSLRNQMSFSISFQVSLLQKILLTLQENQHPQTYSFIRQVIFLENTHIRRHFSIQQSVSISNIKIKILSSELAKRNKQNLLFTLVNFAFPYLSIGMYDVELSEKVSRNSKLLFCLCVMLQEVNSNRIINEHVRYS